MRINLRVSIALVFGLTTQFALAQAQRLTPGAAAIGGVTTNEPLIAPDGTRVPIGSGVTAINVAAPATNTTGSGTAVTGSNIHRPDPNWPLALPQSRGTRGSNSSGASTETAPAPTPAPAATPETSTPTEATANPAPAAPEAQITDETTVIETISFEPARLNFGPDNVELTAQHEIALDPIEAMLRADPLLALRVVAVLPLAEASNEEAKKLARRRILAVRSNLESRGVNVENLTFVISANSSTEQFANFVLIEQ